MIEERIGDLEEGNYYRKSGKREKKRKSVLTAKANAVSDIVMASEI